MIILAADTSGKTLSLALAREGELLAEYSLALGYKHSVTFQPAVADLLDRTGLSVKEVDLFAVATGPGSFTGIRIGLAAVKAMAYAVGAKTLGISSLRALARSAGPWPGLVLPLLDARGGRAYSGLYRQGHSLIDEIPRDGEALLSAIAPQLEEGEAILVAGDGSPVIREQAENLGSRLVFAPPSASFIRGAAIVELAMEDLSSGCRPLHPFELEARYGLASSAQRAREGDRV